MNRYIADFHIHSKYSGATSKRMDLDNLLLHSKIKGIDILGTGDANHPNYLNEIKNTLIPFEDGVFIHKDDKSKNKTYFILSSEISTIYKKEDKTRKIHHLIIYSNIESLENINDIISKYGDLEKDGRPILNLDSVELIEIIKEQDKDALFIPAHVWTPWYGALGDKSGFNSLKEVYEDKFSF